MGLGSLAKLNMMTATGSYMNDLTGATSAGRQSQKYALQSAAVNNAYQKEFAQNAHQWEIEDLKAAGLNPILSAGGSGASASGGGVASGNVTSSGLSPLDFVSASVNAYGGIQNAKQMQAEAKNLDANTLLTKWKTQREALEYGIRKNMSKAELDKLRAELRKTEAEIAQIETGSIGKPLGTRIGSKFIKGWDYITDKMLGEDKEQY